MYLVLTFQILLVVARIRLCKVNWKERLWPLNLAISSLKARYYSFKELPGILPDVSGIGFFMSQVSHHEFLHDTSANSELWGSTLLGLLEEGHKANVKMILLLLVFSSCPTSF